MSTPKKLLVAGAIAAVGIAGALIALRQNADEPAEPAAERAEPAPATPAVADSPSQGAAAGSSLAATPPNPADPAPMSGPGAAPRAMPYRPAKLLRYSEDSPAESPGDDDSAPVLARIFAVTHADAAQQAGIKTYWKTHEDQRRLLWAQAYPRVSGPRILDWQQVMQVDGAFDTALAKVLRPAQRTRLLEEMPPPGEIPPPPTTFKDPDHRR